MVRDDRDLFGQKLASLIENVQLHTSTGSPFKIGLTVQADKILLSVAADGPGITDEERSLVLHRLNLMDERSSTSGIGLGLSLASSIVMLHNAELRLQDIEPGRSVQVSVSVTS